MKEKVPVIVEPQGKSGLFPRGIKLYEALGSLGIAINSSCGGEGRCGRCIVRIIEGICNPSELEREFIDDKDLRRGYRLACQIRVMGGMRVHVPPETRRSFSQTVFGKPQKLTIEPLIKKKFILKPRCSSSLSYLDIMKKAFGGELRISLESLKQTDIYPDGATYVTYKNRIIKVEPGDTTSKCYGLAVDIGTSTISALMVDLVSGDTISKGFLPNPQARYGSDVITRISNSLNSSGLSSLQACVVDGINGLIKRLISDSGVDKNRVYEAVFAGNTSMHHLFLGIPPNSLAVSPYVPRIRDSIYFEASDVGMDSIPNLRCYILPNIAGFVGGDTTGAILACGVLRSKNVSLLIDIGTNGEIVIGSKGEAVAVSCAAGPAFEGVDIACGMPAIEGAVESVKEVDGKPILGVIGNVKPEGICGSGLLDTLAFLLKIGIMDRKGRIKVIQETTHTEGTAFPLNDGVYITQRDIRQLQLAKAAIRAGIELIKKQPSFKKSEIQRVFIAGAFGNYLRTESLLEIGLLPQELKGKITFVGNAALQGARLALLSDKKRDEAERISKEVGYIELMSRADFQEEFIRALDF